MSDFYEMAEHDAAIADAHRDKWGPNQKANAAFLAFCCGEITEADWLKVENEIEGLEQSPSETKTAVCSQ